MSDGHTNGASGAGALTQAISIVAFTLIMAIIVWGLLHLVGISLPQFFSPRTSVIAPSMQGVFAGTASHASSLPPANISSSQHRVARANSAAHLRSPADLAVRIIAITHDSPELTVVEFDVANIGGSASEPYSFAVSLPTEDSYLYRSQMQSPLNPGDHVVNVLRYSRGVSGVVSIMLSARDANQSNNTASRYVSGAYQSYQPYSY